MLDFIAIRRYCISVAAAIALLACGTNSELPAQRPSDNSQQPAVATTRIFVPQTGDAETDRNDRQALSDAMAARRARLRDEAQQEHMRTRDVWQGATAKLSTADNVSDAQRESAAPFVDLFAREDPPAPEGRRDRFAEFLRPDSSDRCVGWQYFVESAEAVDDGWRVRVEVVPNLMGLTPKAVFTWTSTYEVWHVGRDGKLTPVEVTPGVEGVLSRV